MRTCRLVERPYPFAAERARTISMVRDIESWCPRLFKSEGVVDGTPGEWTVAYVATDTTMNIDERRITLTQPRSTADINLGTIASWLSGERPNCEAIPTQFRKAYNFE
jgi:hypothetical protein